MKPKIFLVGDNRNSPNWGRGASIALRQLLTSKYEISGTLTSEWFDVSTAEAGYVGTLMPNRYYRHFKYLLERRSRPSIGWYIRMEERWGARDFIANNPAESVDNLMRYKSRVPGLAHILEQATEADIVVVDGDGDIIFTTPPRRVALFFLAMIEMAVRLKKPVFLTNSMISDCPTTGRNLETVAAYRRLLGKCNAVLLRDPESLAYVRGEMPEAKSSLIPDSLFSWFPLYQCDSSQVPSNGDFVLPFPEEQECWGKLDLSEPYICIGGGALAGAHPERAHLCYSQLVDAVQKLGYRVILTENDLPDSFLRGVAKEKGLGLVPSNCSILMCGAILARARLFISGRYHPSIFASLGGTPCIFLETHSHKCASLSRVLEYDIDRQFSALPEGPEIDAIVSLAQEYLERGESLRYRIRSTAKSRYTDVQSLPAVLQRHLNG